MRSRTYRRLGNGPSRRNGQSPSPNFDTEQCGVLARLLFPKCSRTHGRDSSGIHREAPPATAPTWVMVPCLRK
jgi:hypothetical protein